MVPKSAQNDHFWRWTAQRTIQIAIFAANPQLYVAQYDPKSDHFAQFSDAFLTNIRMIRGSKWYPIVVQNGFRTPF